MLFGIFISFLYNNEFDGSKRKDKRGDMAKSVDATDLIGLSLSTETYQVKTFKFRETLELKKWAILSQLLLSKRKKKDRCRDSMEAVLTNGVDGLALL